MHIWSACFPIPIWAFSASSFFYYISEIFISILMSIKRVMTPRIILEDNWNGQAESRCSSLFSSDSKQKTLEKTDGFSFSSISFKRFWLLGPLMLQNFFQHNSHWKEQKIVNMVFFHQDANSWAKLKFYYLQIKWNLWHDQDVPVLCLFFCFPI